MLHPIIWITGQPGSGKTTLANALREYGAIDVHIDGDDLRAMGLAVGYDRAGRERNIDRARACARFLQLRGEKVAVSLVSPYIGMREELKSVAPVVEVYLTCSVERGREQYFVKEYEPPEAPDLHFDTAEVSVADEVRAVLGALSAAASRT